MKSLLPIVAFLIFYVMIASSCSKTSVIKSKSTVYSLRVTDLDNGYALDSLYRITTKRFKGVVEEKTDYIVVEPSSVETLADTFKFLSESDKFRKGFRASEINKFYFPESSFDLKGADAKFKYSNIRFGLQALTIPFKFRRGFDFGTIKYYPQVETSFNFAFAPGLKKSWNSYKVGKDIWGNHVRTFSITIGGLFGGSAVDLSSKNAPGLVGERKSALYSGGLFAMLGYGKINIGYAIGWDGIAGVGNKYWVYQGKHWNGFLLALELLKF